MRSAGTHTGQAVNHQLLIASMYAGEGETRLGEERLGGETAGQEERGEARGEDRRGEDKMGGEGGTDRTYLAWAACCHSASVV